MDSRSKDIASWWKRNGFYFYRPVALVSFLRPVTHRPCGAPSLTVQRLWGLKFLPPDPPPLQPPLQPPPPCPPPTPPPQPPPPPRFA